MLSGLSRTGKASNRVRHKTDSNNLPPVSGLRQVSNPQPVSSHALNRARCKTINANKWTGPIKTGARELKTITGHNSINEVEAAAEGAADQVEEAGVAVAAGDDNLKY